MPLISVITVTYNAQLFIEASINSIIMQDYQNYEYIIVDGGSTDATLEIINRNSAKITKIISEKDKGIYDAMNKAIKIASGDYLLFIGADDFLYNNSTLTHLAEYIKKDRSLDLIVGKIKYTSGKIFKSKFHFKTLLHNTVHHQGALYHKKLFIDFSYDLQFALIADYELNLRLYLKKDTLNILFVEDFVSLCTDGGLSRLQLKKAQTETNLVRKKVLGQRSIFYKWLYDVKFFISSKLLS